MNDADPNDRTLWDDDDMLRSQQNGQCFADNILNYILLKQIWYIDSNFTLSDDPIDSWSVLTQVMAWQQAGDKPLSEAMTTNASCLNVLTKWLTHLPLVPHICVSELGQHWFRYWLVAYSALHHYLNQCCVIVDWTFGNKLQWNFNQN